MGAKRRKQAWEAGDVFALPLDAGEVALGQVIAYEPSALNSASIALFDVKCAAQEAARFVSQIKPEALFATLLTTRDLLDSGTWAVITSIPARIPMAQRPYEHLRGNGFIGAKFAGSGNVARFARAFYGQFPWDFAVDPLFFDKMLIDPSKKPLSRLVFKRA